jgi:hypothetical protein
LHREILDEMLEERVVRAANRKNHRGVKRKMSKFPIRRPGARCARNVSVTQMFEIVK